MGKIELDHTGSGSGITLSSDGTGLLLDGTAIGGGGGADLYAANEVSVTSQPSATGDDAIAIGDSAVASAANAFAGPVSRASSFNSFAAAMGSNSSSYGASGNYSVALGYQAKASESFAFATGYQAQATNNTSIAMGFQAVSSASQGVALGYKGQATGNKSFGVHNNTSGGATATNSIAIGNGCLASSVNAIAIGNNATADGNSSVAIGKYCDTKGIFGKFVFSGGSLTGNADGTAQSGKQVLMCDTTDATPEALNAHNGTASAVNQVALANNTAFTFSGTVVARESAADGTDCAAWEIKGLIRREGSASTTTLVASTVTAISNTPSWGLALSADTTNGCLKVQATGAASTNIRWVATIHTSEVTYA